MEAKRGMGRGVGVSLLAIVVIVVLVGLFEGSAFAEGDTARAAEERGAEKRAEPLWRDVVDVVSAFAVIVIGVATVWVMITQRRQSGRQERWQKEFAERQERWQKEFAERQQWMAEGERRLEVVKGIVRFYEKLAKGRGIKWWDVQELVVVEIARGLALFKGERRRFLAEVAVKAKEWWETEKKLEEKEERDEAERKKRELEKWFELSGEEMGELAAACWEGR